MNFWKTKESEDPHGQRTVRLPLDRVLREPLVQIKRLIWELILKNCDPPRKRLFPRTPDPTPVTDIRVQTFYVSYPGGGSRVVNSIGNLSGLKIAREIIQEMVAENIFEPYLIDKIGKDNWETANENDKQRQADPSFTGKGRVDAAFDTQIIEVFVEPNNKRSDDCVVVVGRESLATEITQHKQLGRDPDVLAVIIVGESAFTNPHLREKRNKRSHNDPIYILSGRTARDFIVGPNSYDDILVPGMPANEGYRLNVSANEASRSVKARLFKTTGEEITLDPSGEDYENAWSLRGDDGTWSCDLSFTRLQPQPLSKYPDAPQVPPSIQLNGRVLPRTTDTRKYMAAELEKRLPGANATSGITLEPDLYLFAVNDDSEVFLLNLDQNRTVRVTDVTGTEVLAEERGYALENNSTIEIGNRSYEWKFQTANVASIPPQVVGFLESDGDSKDVEVMDVPRQGDKTRWMLGNWRQDSVGAFKYHSNPIFPSNPDLLLSSNGNLIFEYKGRDSQDRPIFQLVLKKVTNELLIIVDTDGSWRPLSWPDFGEESLYPISDVNFVGEGNKLIFGTVFYGIKTSGTLRS